MESPFTRRAAVVRALLILAIGAGVVSAALPRAQAKEIEVPETGTPAQRARMLWQATRGDILADAKAALSDAEYQKRRGPIWGAWIRLQMNVAGEDDEVSKVIPDVLGLINRTYGWTADTPAKRQENRDKSRPHVEKRVEEMDKRIEALK